MKLQMLAGVTFAACFALPSFGQMVVDATWLSQHLQDRDLVVIHVGDAAGFAKGHIAGARNLTIAAISEQKGGLAFELPATDALKSKFESLGVSDGSRIILYGGTEEPLPGVTRVAHVLNFMGLGERTSLLNGGLGAWTNAGHATVTATSAASTGHLTPHVNPALFVDGAFVTSLAQKSGYKLIDARAPAIFKGIEPTFGKAGHIAGAINVPFSDMNDEAQQFNRDHLANVFSAAGVKPGDKLVVYCHIGLQATEVIFGARMLGYDAVLYDGSFQDWATNKRGPVEK